MVLSQQLGGTILHPLSFNMSLRVIIDTATCYCLLSSLKIWKSIGHQLTLFSFLPLPLLFFFVRRQHMAWCHSPGCLGNSWLCWTHTRCLSLIPSNLGGGLAGKQSQKITSMGYQLVNKKGESKLLSGDSYCY